jgi:hypothetical protein
VGKAKRTHRANRSKKKIDFASLNQPQIKFLITSLVSFCLQRDVGRDRQAIRGVPSVWFIFNLAFTKWKDPLG